MRHISGFVLAQPGAEALTSQNKEKSTNRQEAAGPVAGLVYTLLRDLLISRALGTHLCLIV